MDDKDDYVDLDELKVESLGYELEDVVNNSGVVDKLQDLVLESELDPDQRIEAMEQVVEYFESMLRYRYLGAMPTGEMKKFDPETGQYEPIGE
jgi:hypothetical protein